MTERTAMIPVQKLLVLAPNWLGDAVMMTPLLDFLNKSDNFPDNLKPHITLGIRKSWAPLFTADPRIENLIQLDRDGKHAGIRGLFAQAQLLAKDNYDAVIMCPPSLRAGLVAWLARIPQRIGFASDGRSGLLTHAVKKSKRGTLHYSQEMLSLGQALVSKSSTPFPKPKTSLPGCGANPAVVGDGPPVWIMAPGTTYGQAKTWPANHVSEFLDSAVEDKKVRVLLLGDAQTKSFVDSLKVSCKSPWRTSLPGPAGIIDLTGKTGLSEVVGLLKSASAFIGNDSGLMHLAGALGLPTVGLFGSSNPDWTAPLGQRTRALAVNGFPCRPCYRKTCNQKVFCLDKLPAQDVMAAVSEILQENQ